MRLVRLDVHNYKSLRDITIEPGPLSVFVGPNGAGKTNLVDALDFLGDMYRWGLEAAVSRKGGYENICYRHARRSKAPIRFKIMMGGSIPFVQHSRKVSRVNITTDHRFEIRAKSGNIAAPFYITSEEICILEDERIILRALRGRDGSLRIDADESRQEVDRGILKTLQERSVSDSLSAQPIWEIVGLIYSRFASVLREMASLRVYQLSPRNSRESSPPTPSPELDRFGRNLPAVVEFLKNNHEGTYDTLLSTAKKVMPSIDDLATEFTHTKSLGLIIKERGFSRPWPAEDVSDGTIQTIALLAAILDPRSKIVVIEEPENNVHPWAVRNFVEAARIAASSKQIILTTHSPILIDQLRPEELWVVRRPEAETKIDPVMRLAPSLEENWGKGQYTLSEYLDSGILPAAVPAISS